MQKNSKSKQRGANEYGAHIDNMRRSAVRDEGSVENRLVKNSTRNHKINGSRERTISKDRNTTIYTANMMTRTSFSGLKTAMAA